MEWLLVIVLAFDDVYIHPPTTADKCFSEVQSMDEISMEFHKKHTEAFCIHNQQPYRRIEWSGPNTNELKFRERESYRNKTKP